MKRPHPFTLSCRVLKILAAATFALPALSAETDGPKSSYMVIAKKSTMADPAWHEVVMELLAKHQGSITTYETSVTEALPSLKKEFPRYTCFVTPPSEATRTFEIKPNRGEATFKPIDANGSQRGERPIIAFLPKRLKDIEIMAGADLNPVITDDFILIPNPLTCDPKLAYKVIFKAIEL